MIYSNEFGSTLEINDDNTVWKMVHKRNKHNTDKINVYFNEKMIKSQYNWLSLLREYFDMNRSSYLRECAYALRDFYEWLAIVSKKEEDIQKIKPYEFGLFKNHLTVVKGYSESTCRLKLTYLKKMFEELSWRNEDSMFLVSNNVGEFIKNNFKNINNRNFEKNSNKVLSMEMLERVQEGLLEEYHLARDLFDSPFENKSNVDMAIFVAIWLGMKHGVRATELQNLTFKDIVRDKENHLHVLKCRESKSKPNRDVLINNQTLEIIDFYESWLRKEVELTKEDPFLISLNFENGEVIKKKVLNYQVVQGINRFSHKYGFSNDGIILNVTNLRRSYGSFMATQTNNKEVLRQIMGHTTIQNTERHYTALHKQDLSLEVTKGLKFFALELATTYKKPIDSYENDEYAKKLVLEEPDRDYKFGVCSVPKTNETIAKSCKYATNCLECPFLIPEIRKLENYKREKLFWVENLKNIKDDRVKQQRLKRISMLEAYILLMERAIAASKIKKEKKNMMKKSYKKGGKK